VAHPCLDGGHLGLADREGADGVAQVVEAQRTQIRAREGEPCREGAGKKRRRSRRCR
jgi:hypothetical protein